MCVYMHACNDKSECVCTYMHACNACKEERSPKHKLNWFSNVVCAPTHMLHTHMLHAVYSYLISSRGKQADMEEEDRDERQRQEPDTTSDQVSRVACRVTGAHVWRMVVFVHAVHRRRRVLRVG
jgi:hypothetical protein